MALKFVSDEWIIETGKLLKEAFSTPSRVNTALVEIYTDCPDGKTKWIEMKLEKGILTVYNFGEGEAPKAQYRIVGKYEEYVKVASGDSDPEAALMKGAFEFEGNMILGLTLIGIYKKMIQVRQEIPTEY